MPKNEFADFDDRDLPARKNEFFHSGGLLTGW